MRPVIQWTQSAVFRNRRRHRRRRRYPSVRRPVAHTPLWSVEALLHGYLLPAQAQVLPG